MRKRTRWSDVERRVGRVIDVGEALSKRGPNSVGR